MCQTVPALRDRRYVNHPEEVWTRRGTRMNPTAVGSVGHEFSVARQNIARPSRRGNRSTRAGRAAALVLEGGLQVGYTAHNVWDDYLRLAADNARGSAATR